MNWQAAVESTVTGLGYDMVDCERTPGGLLRVYIDLVPDLSSVGAEERHITVEDCERVTRQLQYVLEVEACAYERLEVSSPGLDRPLKKASDYQRFEGSEIEVTLKIAFQGTRNIGARCRRRLRAGALCSTTARPIKHWIFPWMKCEKRGLCPWSTSKGVG